jgi:hypothetical protein
VEGAIVAVKLLTVLVSVQPLFILFPISSTTNDTSRVRAFWWVLVFAPLLLILLGAAAGVFISRSAAGVLGCYIAILVISSLMFLLYRRAYRIGRFDLLSERSQR